MANYEVSNILIKLESSSKSTVQAVNEAQKSLRNLKTTLNGIGDLDLKQIKGNLKTISTLDFSKLKNAFKPLETIDTKKLSSFNRQMKNIANNLNGVDFKKLYQQINTLTRIVDPFIQKIQQAEPSLKAFSNAIDLGRVNAQLMVAEAKVNAINSKSQSRKVLDDVKIQKANVQLQKTQLQLDKIKKKSDKAKNSFSKLFNIGQLYFWLNYTKRVSNALVNMMTSAIDFNETLNKFQVSMGEYYDESVAFVNNLTYAFNLSTESIMNYQSTFKNMLDALGNLGQDNTYQLSETLTRMAIDYASLFNVEITRAMEQFQGVLSGQIRSIRTVAGYDVSEASIFGIYQQLGGTKTMRQLDQVEKRLLRIIALQQQMEKTGAVGDFEKTLSTTANMLKQLSETFKEIGRWIGQLTMVYLEPFIEKVLAGAVALREMLKALNIAQGYKYEDFGEGGLFGAVEESANGANEAVENLKTNLLGFDTLTILGDTSTSSNLPNYSLLLEQIKSYSSRLTEVSNKSNGIAENILTWLGYTKEVDEKTGNVNWKLQEGITNLDRLTGALLGVGSAIATIAIVEKFKDMNLSISSVMTSLKAIPSILNPTALIIAGIVATLVYMYQTNDEFKKSVDGLIESIVNVLKPTIQLIFGILQAFMPIVDTIVNELVHILAPIINSISPIISMIGDVITSLMPIIVTIADLLGGAISVALELIFIALEPIVAVVEILVQLVSGALQIGLGVVKTLVEAIVATFQTIGEFFKSIFSGDGQPFVEKNFTEMADKIKEIWTSVGETIKATFIGIVNNIITAFASFVNTFTAKINGLTSTLSGLWEWAGIPAIPEIPTWQPKLIELAKGGVATQPTPALIGEYAGASSNPEIVTPENLMRQVFVESMLPIAQMIASGNNDVVSAIEDMANRPIHLNGRKVSENIYDDMNKVAIRKTGRALSYAR